MLNNPIGIKIDQTIHGYSGGHCLLAKSIDLSKNSQRQMLIMSDMSGHSMRNGFEEYLTGYPLVDDDYYAFGKTWYASEMKRPGCVWTHTLLIKFDDIQHINNSKILLDLFKRPKTLIKKDDYTNQIKLPLDANTFSCINCDNTTANKLRYLIYSLYSDNKPVILPSESADEYQELILLIWQNQWSKLRSEFSFCTGSLANRKQNGKSLDIQIVPYSLSKSISRTEKDSIILDEDHMAASLSTYPEWVFTTAEEVLFKASNGLKDFLEEFGSIFKERKHFKMLAQLYIVTNAKESTITIDRYLTATKDIFGRAESDLFIKSILEKQLQRFSCRWFSYKDMSEFIKGLSTASGLSKTSIDQKILTNQIEVLWNSNLNKSKELFKNLISEELNPFGELILKRYAKLIDPEELPILTDMDLGACNVLVSINPQFARCPEIWHKSKGFQCELLDCIDKEKVNKTLSKDIIEAILENSSEVLYKQVFSVFGEDSIKIFLDWCNRSVQKEGKMKDWMSICKLTPKTALKWISSMEAIDVNLLISIIQTLDPCSEILSKNGIKPWIKVFKQLDQKEINQKMKLALAQFFLPLILMSDEVVPNDFAEFSFAPVHDELARTKFSYERWSKLEPLLPSVPWYNTWDKCKRLRKAMKRKGYSV